MAITFARSSIIARTSRSGSSGPTPAAWLRTRLTCSSASRSGGIAISESLPKPVVTPYTTSRRSTIASTIARVRAILSRAPPERLTEAPSATAATFAIRSDSPSSTMVAGIRTMSAADPVISSAIRARRMRRQMQKRPGRVSRAFHHRLTDRAPARYRRATTARWSGFGLCRMIVARGARDTANGPADCVGVSVVH